MGQPVGLYLHVPFCREGKCPYCDFYSLPFDEDGADRYTQALLRAMARRPTAAAHVDTVYFGGGTPSLLAHRLPQLLEGVRRHFHLAPDAEITLEMNPDSASPDLLRELFRSGFNRVSLGVQSGDDGELQQLGRRHRFREARDAVEAACRAGFRHISADLMLGIPRQTEASLRATLEALTALPLDHVSAYLLKVEEGTPFAAAPALDHCPGEDAAAALYLQAVEHLDGAGFRQYEVSNFAGPGGRSRHNLKYWRGEEYLGLGPAAHSFLGGRRFYLPRDLTAFLDAEHPLALSVDDGEGGDWEEWAMLRLRLADGLDLEELAARYPHAPAAAVRARTPPLEGAGYLKVSGSRLTVTPRGFLLLNAVTAHLLVE